MNKKDMMYQAINNHGQKLNNIFKTEFSNITLCKKLRRLEAKAHKIAEDYCNGYISEDDQSIAEYDISKKVAKIIGLHKDGIPIYPLFMNRDPRGYALKIDDNYIRDNNIDMYRDWGGYGILAPDLSV